MLFGLAATAIPVVIHLLGKREPPKIELPTARFLKRRLDVNRRHLNIQRWLLMLLRMALICLVVLALAQPRIRGVGSAAWLSIGGMWILAGLATLLAVSAWKSGRKSQLAIGLGIAAAIGWFMGGAWGFSLLRTPAGSVRFAPADAAVAIVVDNSVRMLYREGESTRLANAIDTAKWLAQQFPPASRLAVFDRTHRPTTFAMDAEGALKSIEGIVPVSVEEPLDRRLEAAIRLVRTSELQNRAVYVITDLTTAGWDTIGADRLRNLLQDGDQVTLQLIDVGSIGSPNWRIQNLRLPSLPLAAGAVSQIEAEVIAPPEDGTKEISVELVMFKDEKHLPVVKAGQVELPETTVLDRQTFRAGTSEGVLLNLPPLEPGIYHGFVKLDAGDPLKVDDQVPWTIAVGRAPQVLIVGNDAVERTAMSAVLYDPKGAANDFAVTAVGPESLETLDLTKYRTIIWLDPTTVSGTLANWTKRGGNLIVILGPHATEGNLGEELAPKIARQWRVPQPGSYLELVQGDYPSLRELARSNIPWPQYPVRIYWQVEPGEGTVVPMRYAGTGHPAMLDLPWVSGRLVVFTTPIPGLSEGTRGWNELLAGSDAWPVWLLVRQTVDLLARADQGILNVVVGTPVSLPQRPGDPQRYQLFAPSGAVGPLDVAGEYAVPGATLDVGVYWLRGGGVNRGFSATLRSDQTILQRLDRATLSNWFGESLSVATDRDQVRWAEGEAKAGQSLYAQAMIAAVLIWLFEQLLANRFYKTA
jgi:hypothetical protein